MTNSQKTRPAVIEMPGVELGAPKPRIGFLFSGQGFRPYPQMGMALYQTNPTFRQSINDAAEHFARHGEALSLGEILYGEGPPSADVVYAHVAGFATAYALAKTWLSFGVSPELVIGHSLGEYVAAVIADVMTLDAAIELIVVRGRRARLHEPGEMLAIHSAAAALQQILADVKGAEIACVNAPKQTVVACDFAAGKEVRRLCHQQKIAVRALPIGHAFHSSNIDPILDDLRQAAQQVQFAPPKMPFVSSLSGNLIQGNEIDAEYWVQNTRAVVQFHSAMQTAAALGIDTFIEIGPHPQLIGLGMDCENLKHATWLSSLKRDEAPWAVLAGSIKELFVRGIELDWAGFLNSVPATTK